MFTILVNNAPGYKNPVVYNGSGAQFYDTLDDAQKRIDDVALMFPHVIYSIVRAEKVSDEKKQIITRTIKKEFI